MKSAISLSMHKAGSSVADRIFAEVFRARGYEIDQISFLVPKASVPEPEVYRQYQAQMKPDGVYYGIARHWGAHEMEILPSLRMIIQVRDPRDCLTSAYFSYKKSHRPPIDPESRKRFEMQRAELQEMSIDEFALKNAANYQMRLNLLSRHAREHPDVLVVTYEDMVQKTEAWLAQISEFIEQPITPELRQKIAEHIEFSVAEEDASSHKRQVTPGDHRRKLKPETIARINAVLAPGLQAFCYPVQD
ncbi:hypothetical protein E7681_03575 [Thalassobius vesicularis]|uniref:Sulfotransferase domain-containing protein n=1 Tax=Thalassobius vesicularis TaxID=1294297 RepID=A0A4S3MGQ6_9RHOB|nr:sulfotransferase domain-containing protein [Thalassobius vesicularis]THD76934.1 hypothetical protein E7681_03575 [Thalassobius vesicularis]